MVGFKNFSLLRQHETRVKMFWLCNTLHIALVERMGLYDTWHNIMKCVLFGSNYLVTETRDDFNTLMIIAVIDCLNCLLSTPSSLFAVSCRDTMCHSLYKILYEQITKYIANGYC